MASPGPIFTQVFQYQQWARLLGFTPVSISWFAPLSEPVRVKPYQLPGIQPALFETLGFTPTNISWLPRWPDFAPRARQPVNYQPWSFIPPPAQVFFPYDRWPDLYLRAKRSAEFPQPVLG